MTKEELNKKLRQLAQRPSEEEMEYWYNTLSRLFKYSNSNDDVFSYENVIPQKNENIAAYTTDDLFREKDKSKIIKYFKNKIPDEKLIFDFSLYDNKYLTFQLTIYFDDDSTLILNYNIVNRSNKIIRKEFRIKYSKCYHSIPVIDFVKDTFLFDKIIEFYTNYDEYLSNYRKVKTEKEKSKKVTTINKLSAEQLAKLYFTDYELNIEGEIIELIIQYSKNIKIKYKTNSDEFTTAFENIKKNLEATKDFFISLNEYNFISIEKGNTNEEFNKALEGKKLINQLIKDKKTLKTKIENYIVPKIVMKGKRPFIYSESHLTFYFLQENGIYTLKRNMIKEEYNLIDNMVKEICNIEKEKKRLEFINAQTN